MIYTNNFYALRDDNLNEFKENIIKINVIWTELQTSQGLKMLVKMTGINILFLILTRFRNIEIHQILKYNQR